MASEEVPAWARPTVDVELPEWACEECGNETTRPPSFCEFCEGEE